MKPIVLIAACVLMTACGPNQGKTEGQPNATDTFAADTESATNGPDNASPQPVDSGNHRT